eukprot:TRINITY_DN8201_c0_g1_i1.p1 TRINITY_DN8201_c0_g1~~TRINITY_DN8201_c0_g1_i1.p1  ORF type:complete len:1015 (+),score=363.64 TRINITY_DN8201_c0_g1_i1:126-3170(+)
MNVPSSFSPNDLPALLTILSHTLSPDPNFRKPAEEQLNSYENIPGFSSLLLLAVEKAESVGVDIRNNAVIVLKNILNRLWKKKHSVVNNPSNKAGFSAISEEEKNHIRKTLLEISVKEENQQIVLQLALIFSIITRSDYPQYWPDLVPQLLHQINQEEVSSTLSIFSSQSEAGKKRLRSLLIFHHVVKTFISMRIPASRRQFESISPSLFSIILKLWNLHIDSLLMSLNSLSSQPSSPNATLEIQYLVQIVALSLKILKKLITHGVQNWEQNQDVISFFQLLHDRLNHLLLCRQNGNLFGWKEEIMTLMEQCGKIIEEVQNSNPVAFCNFLRPFLEQFSSQFFYWTEQPLVQYSTKEEKFVIRLMLFLKNVMEAIDYYPLTPEEEETTSAELKNAKNVVTAFYSSEMVLRICEKIVTRYFPMNQKNLEEWEDSPEDFHNDQETEAWKDKIKPCSENLFIGLLERYREWLAPLVKQMLESILRENSTNVEDMNQIILRDACYSALGLSNYYLFEFVDFPEWWKNHFMRELSVPDPRYKIIRRRIAWVIRLWVNKVSMEMRGLVYGFLIEIMKEEDVVMRLTAIATLRALIDNVEFYVDPFMDYLDKCIVFTFKLLHDVEECDTKLQVLQVIQTFITQLEGKIAPYAIQIIEQLKNLWNISANSESYNLLKQSIVRTCSLLVNSVGQVELNTGTSDNLEILKGAIQFSVPVISHSVNESNPDSVYLMEDGLVLWETAMKQSPDFVPELLPLFAMMPSICANTSEHIFINMKIVEEYLVLGRVEFLKVYATSLVSIFSSLIGTMKDSATIAVMQPMEIFIQLFPQEAVQCLEPVLHQILKQILSGKESSLLVVNYLVIFGRILVARPDLFLELFSRIGGQTILIPFIEVWLEKMDSMGQPKIRKLSALSLCNLLPTTQPELMQYTGQIINVAVSVSNDSQEASWIEELDEDEGSVKVGNVVKRQLYKNDPVYCLSIKQHLSSKLNEALALNGTNYQQVMNSVDPSIIKSYHEMMNKS